MKLDKVTDLLCSVCQQIESGAVLKTVPAYLEKWWKEHKAADKERDRKLAEFDRQENVKRAALEKLTPEEKKLLRII
jgi:hypothetical protein